jgi:hypothetical protein
MKKITLFMALLLSASLAAQLKPTQSTANFELGSGLNFAFNDSTYLFKLSGMLQPYIAFDKAEGSKADYYLYAKRAYFNFGGNAVRERVSFFFQLDFSSPAPLLDAWVGFHPIKRLNIYAGQKQTIANNREMLLMEDHLQFADRSLLSTSYSRTGREFGVFADYTIRAGNVAIVPQIAVTNGDGRNSFGADSRDVDFGGFKYAARLDVYPFGEFSRGNQNQIVDLAHEQRFKMVLGGAASYNDGASEAVGEGHGVFTLYSADGSAFLPDYRQVFGDVLMKYKGFSLLGEYGVATATNLEGAFRAETGNDQLLPTEISEYLALGTGYNVQAGYVTLSGYGLDARLFGTMPEFAQNAASVIQENNGWSVGFSKYFKGQAAKIQVALTSLANPTGMPVQRGEILFQVIF